MKDERDPSVHMTYSSLVIVLDKIGIKDAKNVARRIIQVGLPYAIKDRYVISGDSSTKKKAVRLIKAGKNNQISVEKFNSLLYKCRINAQHSRITNITKGDVLYPTLVEITQLASEFSVACGFDNVEEGCRVFIELGLGMMKYNNQYSLNKFKYYKEKIYNLYDCAEMIENDPHEEETKEVYELWRDLMLEYGRLERKLTKIEDYVNMVCIRQEADNHGANYEDWLRGQFEFFKAMSLVPNLGQLFNDKASNRYYDYMSQHRKKVKKKVNQYEAKSDFQKRYEQARKKLMEKE